MEKTESGRGSFFVISPDTWAAACDLGMNEAVAYLVLAQGTAGNNRTTSWSAESLHKYTGIAWVRAKAAIEHLVKAGLLCYGENHTPKKPRYELTSPAKAAAERYQANVAALSDEERCVLALLSASRPRLTKSLNGTIDRLAAAGLVKESGYRNFIPVKPPGEESKAQPSEPIWLPNTLVTGTSEGENAPIKRIRQTGDVWALRLLVDLYTGHNLRDDGGIRPARLRLKFERKAVGQFGMYTVWAFKPENHWVTFDGELAAHKARPKPTPECNHPFWATHHLLMETGLLSYVPHLWDNDPTTSEMTASEILHPYGMTGYGGESIELEIGQAAHEAGLRMAFEERVTNASYEGFRYLCPVRSAVPNACMVGVARLRYRPHTSRTGAWMTRLLESGPAIRAEFEALAADKSVA
jgi:hypothetical protein